MQNPSPRSQCRLGGADGLEGEGGAADDLAADIGEPVGLCHPALFPIMPNSLQDILSLYSGLEVNRASILWYSITREMFPSLHHHHAEPRKGSFEASNPAGSELGGKLTSGNGPRTTAKVAINLVQRRRHIWNSQIPTADALRAGWDCSVPIFIASYGNA